MKFAIFFDNVWQCRNEIWPNIITVKSRFYWVFGRQQRAYKIEIINKIEIFYLLLVAEGSQYSETKKIETQ